MNHLTSPEMLASVVFLILGQLAQSEHLIGFPDGVKTLQTLAAFNERIFRDLSAGRNIQFPWDAGDDMKENVIFGLYTAKNQTYQRLYADEPETLAASNFSITRPTDIVIHGFLDNMDSEAIQTVKDAILEHYDHNVIGVDWGAIAITPIYTNAASATESVGEYVAQLIELLVSYGAPLSSIHLIGHSLGAHVCGFAGQHTKSGKVGRISGLDPALPYFYTVGPDERLDPTDADFVDCIHTCGGVYGFLSPICDVDFYPNGGVPEQPGCPYNLAICSHSRSFLYFAESVNPASLFPSQNCTDVPDREGDGCTKSNVIMGFDTQAKSGIYYALTNPSSPYSPLSQRK